MDVTDEDGVRTVTFDRPGVMNAMTPEVAKELADALAEANPTDHDAVVITGEGPAFSAGGDIQAMKEREYSAAEAYDHVTESFGRIVEEAMTVEVPTVARINGDAVGAGLAVAAICDFAYAVESATFSCAFVRVGLIPDSGGSFLLPHLVGLRDAKRLAFTGEFFPASEAAELDLINEAVPEDELDDAVEELLGRLRDAPTKTVGLTKRALHGNMTRDWRDALEYENSVQVQAYGSEEHAEGVDAFLEGRDPEWD
jgi:2-(1,2-epoxy-1,2-dihydrophenyl)acetyl-CoA isomerase